MRVQHNIAAMNSYRIYNNNASALGKNLEKLSSGYRINRAGDDAAGLAISEKMRGQITGLNAASKNVKDGIALVQTAEGAMQEVHDMLGRMKYLATQSSNGTYQDEVDRENLQKEVDALVDEIDRIADSANFNGQKLLDGSLAGVGGKSKVKVEGVNSAIEAATKHKFAVSFTGAAGNGTVGNTANTNLTVGNTLDLSVSLTDGTSFSVSLTMTSSTGGNIQLKDKAGNTILSKTGTSFNNDEILNALGTELKKTNISKSFDVTVGTKDATLTQALTFEALSAGTSAVKIDSFNLTRSSAGGVAGGGPATVVTQNVGTDAGRKIASDDVKNYTGGNYDEAVFTINGKKFVLVSTMSTSTKGLGSDVTVLVGQELNSGDANWADMKKKIEEATGMTVRGETDGIIVSGGAGSGGLGLQIGDTGDSYNKMKVSVNDMHAVSLGLKNLDISTADAANSAIDTIKRAIDMVSSNRGDLGAVQNRLEHTSNNLSVMTENLQNAESNIRDTDVADEMMKYTKNNILLQSAQAMLAQANQLPQGVLQLLQ